MHVAVASPPPTETPAAEAVRFHRFTVAQYHRMIDLGIFKPSDRVELFRGWIIRKMTHKPPHDATVTRIMRRLSRVLADEWILRVQCSIAARDSEPEPDIAVVRGPEEKYFTRHPGSKDIALLIEVADATLTYDREAKGPLYARERIQLYWIANLIDARVEVFTDPKAGKAPAYRQRRDYTAGESVPLVLDGREVARIPVRELLL
jgi:Uma2 family endonuclease